MTQVRIGTQINTYNGTYQVTEIESKGGTAVTVREVITPEDEDGNILWDEEVLSDEVRYWTKAELAKALKEDNNGKSVTFELMRG